MYAIQESWIFFTQTMQKYSGFIVLQDKQSIQLREGMDRGPVTGQCPQYIKHNIR